MHSNWKKHVVDSFDAKAGMYNNHSDLQEQIADLLVGHLPDLTQPEILEIGCGTGRLTKKLIGKYQDASFHITDISPGMVEQAQQSIQHTNPIQWHVMDGEAVEGNRSYDLIVSNMAFQWFEHPERSISSLRTLLKPEGRLFFTVPSANSFKEWRSALSELSLSQSTLSTYEWQGILKEEEIVVDYDTTFNFLRNLKDIGANVPDSNYRMLKSSELKKACAMADQKYAGRITWHILFGCVPA